MITNERQHRIGKAEIKRFDEAIEAARSNLASSDVHPRLHQAMIEGLESQRDELLADVSQYEALREGKVRRRVLASLVDLPAALIEGRIAARLTQRELGTRLGLPEQQIQRYEKTLYAGVSLDRLQAVAEATGTSIEKVVKFGVAQKASTTARARSASRRAAASSRARAKEGGKAMSRRRTSNAAASAAGKTLSSKSVPKAAKKAAASDLAQVRNNKTTSKSAASAAGKTLGSKRSTTAAKKAAASDLSQSARKKKR